MTTILSAKSIIKFEPESELLFHGPYIKPITVSLKLKPISSTNNYAFKVKTTVPKYYSVSPTHGYILNNNLCNINITFNGTDQDIKNIMIKHKFLIQIIQISDDDKSNLNSMRPDLYWKEVFNNNNNDKIIYEHKLQCTFDKLEQSTSTSTSTTILNQEKSTIELQQKQFKSFVDNNLENCKGLINRLLSLPSTSDDQNDNQNNQQEQQQQRKFSIKTLFYAIITALLAIVAALPIYLNRLRSNKQQQNNNVNHSGSTTLVPSSTLPPTISSTPASSTRTKTTSIYTLMITISITIISIIIYYWRKQQQQQPQQQQNHN